MEKYKVILHAEDTYSGPFWDEDSCEIGRTDALYIDKKEYKVDFPGFKEWYNKADKYDPFTDVEVFQKEGFDEWVNQGYFYAVMLRNMLPLDIDVYYGFWKDFGDGNWRYCKAYITKKE
jgi:hypothetical protein